jgi:syntaxin 1B/2/3
MGAMNGQSNQPTDPNAILNEIPNECQGVIRGIEEVQRHISKFRGLYIDRESMTGKLEIEQYNATMEELRKNIMALYRNLVERVRRIKSKPESSNAQNAPKVGSTQRRLRAALDDYQRAEADYRARLKAQKKRDLLTIKPDATEAELEEVAEDLSDTNLFQQAVSVILLNDTAPIDFVTDSPK